MTTLAQSEIFFFISSIGFIILGILATVVLVYMARVLNLSLRILKKAEGDIGSIGNTAKEIVEDIQDTGIFRYLFTSIKKRKSK